MIKIVRENIYPYFSNYSKLCIFTKCFVPAFPGNNIFSFDVGNFFHGKLCKLSVYVPNILWKITHKKPGTGGEIVLTLVVSTIIKKLSKLISTISNPNLDSWFCEESEYWKITRNTEKCTLYVLFFDLDHFFNNDGFFKIMP